MVLRTELQAFCTRTLTTFSRDIGDGTFFNPVGNARHGSVRTGWLFNTRKTRTMAPAECQ